MVELNQQISWVPEHIKDGSFGKWLENARDWSISRNRYWGSPIPVWESDDPRYPRVDVYGSLDELERDFGVRPTDLHRPYVDELTRPNPDDPTGALDHAPGARGARLLVRVRLDAVRPGALPVRERGLVRAPLPGRLHRRVHRADPRLVLHAARAGHGAVRPARVPHLREPRHPAGRRRPQDEQEPAQLPRRARGVRARRVRRDALVPDVVAGAARRQPRRHRAGHPGRRPPGAHPAVERLVLLHALRRHGDRGRVRGRAPDGLDRRARPLRAGQDARPRRRRHPSARRVRRGRRLPERPRVPRRADELVRAPLAGAVLGDRGSHGRRPRGLRHPVHGARDAVHGGCAAAAADHRGDLARADRGAERAPARLALRRRAPGRPRPGRQHGPGPRGGVDDAGAAQGPGAAGAAAARRPHRGRGGGRGAQGLRGRRRRRGQREGGAPARPRRRRGGPARGHAAAHGQRAGRRATAGQGRPGGDPGEQGR